MQMIIGYLLIILGVAMEIISVLVWLGVLKPAAEGAALQSVTFWDVLLELTKRAPWPAVVGLLNIYAGLKLIGVVLPF
jgi:hydrogenase/urease accessory protein HupE